MLRIGIVAGESSGDILGAGLIAVMRSRVKELTIEGIGGDKMLKEGINSLYPMEKLSVMGITEVISCYFELHTIRKNLLDHFIKNPPDVFIGIDSPDFNLWLERMLKNAGIKTVHYVSPSVWAWRQYRINKIYKSVDLMLNLFPFETEIYDKNKIPNKFVGHPLADKLFGKNNMQKTRDKLGLPQNKIVIAILPGSRKNEINKISKPLLLASELANKTYPNLIFVSGFINNETKKKFDDIKNKVAPNLKVNTYVRKTHDVMDAANIIMLSLGTATLEAMLLKKSMIVVYKTSWVTCRVIKNMVKIPYLALPNILSGKMIVPEFMHEKCNHRDIYAGLKKMLENNDIQEDIKKEFIKLSLELKKDANENAASAVLNLIRK